MALLPNTTVPFTLSKRVISRLGGFTAFRLGTDRHFKGAFWARFTIVEGSSAARQRELALGLVYGFTADDAQVTAARNLLVRTETANWPTRYANLPVVIRGEVGSQPTNEEPLYLRRFVRFETNYNFSLQPNDGWARGDRSANLYRKLGFVFLRFSRPITGITQVDTDPENALLDQIRLVGFQTEPDVSAGPETPVTGNLKVEGLTGSASPLSTVTDLTDRGTEGASISHTEVSGQPFDIALSGVATLAQPLDALDGAWNIEGKEYLLVEASPINATSYRVELVRRAA